MENLIFCQNPHTETFAANPQYLFFQLIAFWVLSFVKKADIFQRCIWF